MRSRVLVGVAAGLAVAVTGASYAAAGHGTASARPAPAACPSAVRGLGRIAYVTRGSLESLDLRTCRARQVSSGGAWSPQFSPNGRWLAFSRRAPDHSGSPLVVAAAGGPVRSPLGAGIRDWWWGPRGATLYGVNRHGQLLRAGPGGPAKVVAGGDAAFAGATGPSPDGRRVATERSTCQPMGLTLDTVTVAHGAQHAALSRDGGLGTFAGWSADGRWLLYWAQSMCSASLSADGWPLDAVPSTGAGHAPVKAVAHMLLFPDFLTWCGARLIAASTPSRETQLGGKLVATGPPGWRQHTIDSAARLSWTSPTCAPSGTLLAAAAGRDSPDAEFGQAHRSIWLLTPGGKVVRQLTAPPASDESDEAPRFSRDGRWILFVRSRLSLSSGGIGGHSDDTLELVHAARTGAAAAVPVASVTSSDISYYDHFQWPSEVAWSAS
jgi:hypothetical protein